MTLLRAFSFLLLAIVKGEDAMILYELAPAQPEYLLNQEIKLKLRITNQGTAPVQVPNPGLAVSSQPVVAIAGPGFDKPQLFSMWSAAHPGVEAPPPTEMTVAPGATWEGVIPLASLVPIREPGEFRLSSMLASPQGPLRSKNTTFRVSRADPISVHLGIGQRPFGNGQGHLVFLQREGSAAALYTARFQESDPSNTEVQVTTVVRRLGVSAAAADVASPWRNSPFFNELLQWVVWREGKSVKALSSAEKAPVSFDLPEEPSELVRPPLKETGGPVEVLVVSGNRRGLSMIAVPSQLKPQPSLTWRAELPAAPHSITAALAPGKGSPRHLAFTAAHDRGFEIFHSRYAAGAPEPFQSVRIPAGTLLPHAQVTMMVTADGIAHVAALSHDGDGKYSLIEAQFGPGEPVAPKVTAIGPLEKEPSAAAVLYTDREGSIARRDVVFKVEGAVLKWTGEGALTPLRGEAPAVMPLILTPGESVTYILCFTPEKGFYFEPV
jgi:hypothetical protein